MWYQCYIGEGGHASFSSNFVHSHILLYFDSLRCVFNESHNHAHTLVCLHKISRITTTVLHSCMVLQATVFLSAGMPDSLAFRRAIHANPRATSGGHESIAPREMTLR